MLCRSAVRIVNAEYNTGFAKPIQQVPGREAGQPTQQPIPCEARPGRTSPAVMSYRHRRVSSSSPVFRCALLSCPSHLRHGHREHGFIASPIDPMTVMITLAEAVKTLGARSPLRS